MDLSRGTNPIIDFTIPNDIPASSIREVVFTLEQMGKIIAQKYYSKNEITNDGQMFTVRLSQEETLDLNTAEIGKVGLRVFTDVDDYVTEEVEPIYVKDGGLTHGKVIHPEV